MDRPTCKTCPYWEELNAAEGECRRYPATVRVRPGPDEHQEADAVWLVTMVDPEGIGRVDWCGEHPDFAAYVAATREGA